jgi:glycosyltransferase involved in cell wall biosynthesis
MRLAFRHIDLFVATHHIKYVELHTYFKERVTLEPNCVRLDRYLKFREDKYPSLNTRFTITYTGSFGTEKNPNLLIKISEKRPDIVFRLVGKIPGSLRLHLGASQNVELHGPVGVDIIPQVQMESTALLVTLEPRNLTSSKYTSTMKLIEYIAAGRPIIAPNLDSVLAILNSSEFYSYVADSADSLSAAIDSLQADVLRDSIRLPRAERLDQYSWDLRNSRLFNRISLL